jgi:hypothetical protein
MIRWLLIVAVVCGAAYHYYKLKRPIEVEQPPLVTVSVVTESRAPLQRNLNAGPVFRMNGYTLTALAEFSIGARVILAREYSSDRESSLAPVDLALAWGPMADPRVLEAISFSQAGRFYHWRYEGAPPIPHREIELNSANMHMIPSTKELAAQLRALKPGNLVRLRGYLVQANAPDGWHWRSSLTREDTGGGACEVIFVQALEVLGTDH